MKVFINSRFDVRYFLLAVMAAFSISGHVWAIGIPDYLDLNGKAVYEVNAASTDSPFLRNAQAALRVDAGDYPGLGINFWVRYTDGKYEEGQSGALGSVVLSGVLVDNIQYNTFDHSDTANFAYIMCGGSPRLIFHGYWQNWIIYVNGVPVYGSDFTVTLIETTEGACAGFP